MPGMDVKDQLSHLIGYRAVLLGILRPPLEGHPDHVTNAFGELNEVLGGRPPTPIRRAGVGRSS